MSIYSVTPRDPINSKEGDVRLAYVIGKNKKEAKRNLRDEIPALREKSAMKKYRLTKLKFSKKKYDKVFHFEPIRNKSALAQEELHTNQ